MKTKLQKPADLDNTRLHTREEFRAWQEANREYHAAIRAEEQREQMKERAKAEQANRVLTEDEYWALAQEREAAKQAKQAERDAEEKAKADEKAAYLTSQPDVALVSETNPYTFLLQVTHWAGLGYSLSETADITVLPSYYSASFNKPEQTAPVKKAAK